MSWRAVSRHVVTFIRRFAVAVLSPILESYCAPLSTPAHRHFSAAAATPADEDAFA
jgi:hypothetical protein